MAEQFNFSRDLDTTSNPASYKTLVQAPSQVVGLINKQIRDTLTNQSGKLLRDLKKELADAADKSQISADLKDTLKDELDDIYKLPIQQQQQALAALKQTYTQSPGAQNYIQAFSDVHDMEVQVEEKSAKRLVSIRETLTKNAKLFASVNPATRFDFAKQKKEADEAFYNSQLDQLKALEAEQLTLKRNSKAYKAKQKEIDATKQNMTDALTDIEADKQERLQAQKGIKTGNWTERRQKYTDAKALSKQADKALADYKAAGGNDQAHLKQLEDTARQMKDGVEETKADMNDNAKNAKEVAVAALKQLQALGSKVAQTVESFYAYQAKMEGLLQGSGTTYKQLMKDIVNNIGLNPIIKQADVMEKMRTLVESGITYNVELRSFLATLSEDIDATFDAFSDSLKTIIRVQQEDSTLERLGMESRLTQLYNKLFKDTSYLASDTNSAVQSALTDAIVGMTKNQALEFEYIVQKWLGSMQAVGVGSNTVQKIAQGLNYLATGDVESLSNDSALQMLFTMSANRAGKSYANMLNNGLTSTDTNELLKAMVEYLQEISESTKDNNVVQKQYSNILGVSMTDLTAINNLSQSTINQLGNNTMSVAQMVTQYDSQIELLSKRVHSSQQITNVLDNVISATANSMATDAGGISYIIYKAADLFDSFTGEIFKVASPSVMGTGPGLGDFTYADLVQMGVSGVSLISALIKAAGNREGGWRNRFSSNVIGGSNDIWGYESTITRGSIADFSSGVSTGTSESSESVEVGSAEDMMNSALSDATDQANESSTITNKETAEDHTFEDFYKNVFEDDVPLAVKVLEDTTLDKLYDSLFVSKDRIAVEGITPSKTSNANSFLSSVSTIANFRSESNTATTETNETSNFASGLKSIGQAISSALKSSSDNDYEGTSVIELLQSISSQLSATKSEMSEISSTVSYIYQKVGS